MLSGIRAGLAALALLLALPLLGARLPRGRAWLWPAVTGLLGVALFYEGLGEAAARAGAGNAAVLANSSPFFVLVLGWVFLREPIRWRGALGLVIGFAGVVLMVSNQLGGDADTGSLVFGMGLALAAAAGWAVTTLIVKWLVERDPDFDLVGLTTGQHVVGAIVLLALAFGIDGAGGTDWSSGDLWGAIAYLAFGASVAAYLAFFGALKRIDAARASAWLFLVPVVAVIIEVVLGEVPEPVVLLGMGLAIAGVALASVSPRKEVAGDEAPESDAEGVTAQPESAP
jgi:drug/metabolite transporter (DMT)-like permease